MHGSLLAHQVLYRITFNATDAEGTLIADRNCRAKANEGSHNVWVEKGLPWGSSTLQCASNGAAS